MAEAITITITLDDDRTLSAIYGKPLDEKRSERDKKLVVMIHDFPGHQSDHDDLYGVLESLLNHKGFHTLRFDFLNWGKSSTVPDNFSMKAVKDSLDAVKEWAKYNKYRDFVFVSQGLGCTAAILNMEVNVKSQIMFWPGLDPKSLAESLFAEDDQGVGARFVRDLSKTNLIPHFQDVTMPVLILQGSEDTRYPISQLDLARKYMTSKRIEITTFHDGGCGLTAQNHRKSMFYHIMQFIEKYA